jgi:hypothetical protein
MPTWLKATFAIGGGILGGLLIGATLNALTSSSEDADEDDDDRLSPRERLAANREQGALFEELVGETLAAAFPDAQILSQVSVVTPEGRGRRVDFAVRNPNGSVTPVEVKNVSELLEKHVQQAEDHRAGLKHSHGVRSGLPIVAVRSHTIVPDGLAARIRLIRVSTE